MHGQLPKMRLVRKKALKPESARPAVIRKQLKLPQQVTAIQQKLLHLPALLRAIHSTPAASAEITIKILIPMQQVITSVHGQLPKMRLVRKKALKQENVRTVVIQKQLISLQPGINILKK